MRANGAGRLSAAPRGNIAMRHASPDPVDTNAALTAWLGRASNHRAVWRMAIRNADLSLCLA
jgi:hypothetical protein